MKKNTYIFISLFLLFGVFGWYISDLLKEGVNKSSSPISSPSFSSGDLNKIQSFSEKSPVISLDSQKNDSTTTKQKKNSCRILALGDSLTAGYALDITASYPSRLEAILKKTEKIVRG